MNKQERGEFVINLAEKIVSELKPFCKKIELAGSIRRKEKFHKDIDIILIPKDKKKIIELMNRKGKFIQGGEKKIYFKVQGIKVEFYFTTPQSWGATLLAYSSKKGSAIGLRIVARLKGFHLNQYGLFRDGKMIAGKTEEEIYHALGRKFKSPEER